MKKTLAVALLVLGGFAYNLAASALSVIVFLLGIVELGLSVYLAIPAMWVALGIPIKKLCRKYESKYNIKSPIFFWRHTCPRVSSRLRCCFHMTFQDLHRGYQILP